MEGERKKKTGTPNLPIENQAKQTHTIQRDTNINEEDLPTDSNTLKLRGRLTTEALQKLKNHYTEISLYMVSGEDGKGPIFIKTTLLYLLKLSTQK